MRKYDLKMLSRRQIGKLTSGGKHEPRKIMQSNCQQPKSVGLPNSNKANQLTDQNYEDWTGVFL